MADPKTELPVTRTRYEEALRAFRANAFADQDGEARRDFAQEAADIEHSTTIEGRFRRG